MPLRNKFLHYITRSSRPSSLLAQVCVCITFRITVWPYVPYVLNLSRFQKASDAINLIIEKTPQNKTKQNKDTKSTMSFHDLPSELVERISRYDSPNDVESWVMTCHATHNLS